MKKAEMINLSVGSKVKSYKGGVYEITNIYYNEFNELDHVRLDDIKRVGANTLKKNYSLVEVAPVEYAKEEVVEVPILLLQAPIEEPIVKEEEKVTTTTNIENLINSIPSKETILNFIELKEADPKKDVVIKATKVEKIEKTKEIDPSDNTITLSDIVEEAKALGLIAEEKKGRTAIKYQTKLGKLKCTTDIKANKRGIKFHVRRSCVSDEEYRELVERGIAKDLPKHWALDLEVRITNLEEAKDFLVRAKAIEVGKDA